MNNIKALALADLHIDINNRFDDMKLTLTKLAKYVIVNKIDVIYIIGDIYERKRPYNIEKSIFERWVKVLADSEVSVVIIPGNHDMDKDNVSAVEEFAILKLPYITVKNNPCIVTLGKFDIFLGHFLVNGAKLGSHDFVADTNITVKGILKNYNANLYLLGDVHKSQQLNKSPDMLYTGSPKRNNFGERKELPSFVLIEAGEELKWEWVRVEDREMFQIEVNSLEELLATNYRALDEAIVKIIISCSKEEYNKIDESIIIEKFKGTNSLKIEYNIEREDRVRNLNITENCTTVQAFESYASVEGLSKNIIDLGLGIINRKEE